jgi:hypothetical protein
MMEYIGEDGQNGLAILWLLLCGWVVHLAAAVL